MKTYKNLYRNIYTFDNLLMAWQKARKGKRHQPVAAAFEQNLAEEMVSLHDELATETYQPGGYRHFTVFEGKRRKISAAPFRDRVVHHALCNLIVPIYEQKFIYDTYANRVGKGTHKALNRCKQFMQRFEYVLPCDIQQFFPAIDHQILKDTLGRTFADTQLMNLCGKIIDSGQGISDDTYTMRYFPGDDLFAVNRPRGLPIGNLTSQFWANVYLHSLDLFVKHDLRCKGYVRYVDDFLLFANEKNTLKEWQQAIISFLHRLRLTIHEKRAQPIPVAQGLPFLGFVNYPTHRLLQRKKGIRYRRHLHSLYQDYQAGDINRERLDASVKAWVGHTLHGDTWGLRTQVLGQIVL